MTYSIIFSDHAKKFLDKLSKKEKEFIIRKLYSIRDNPVPHLKRLTNSPFWRLRIADFRAIVDVVFKNNTLYVVRIGHRKNVYD